MNYCTFSAHSDRQFTRTLNQRVQSYFKDRDISKHHNRQMVIKSAALLGSYIGIYLFMLLAGITQFWILALLWVMLGAVKAFIGTSVMHDALHGSYSNRKIINRMMSFSAVLIGADPGIWKIQHNVLHHTYTNIEDHDEDIAPRYVLRFSPHQPIRWFHRFQHIYALFFYTISTLTWVTFKDFVKIFQYRKKGLLKKNIHFGNYLVHLIARKLLYYTIFLVIPLLVLPLAPGFIILLFVIMHLTAGFLLSMVFQPAHVMPVSYFDTGEDHQIDNSWSVHQLLTTTNFAMKSRWLSWTIGSLNYQIEHHLFPHICHVHYPALARIVQQTTAEFNLPYHAQPTLFSAIQNHFSMLYRLGNVNALQKPVHSLN